MNVSKAIQLARLIPTRPTEAWDRVATVMEVRLDRHDVQPGDYAPLNWDQMLDQLDRTLDADCSAIASEPALLEFEAAIEKRRRERTSQSPFAVSHDGDLRLGRLCYIATRATTPKTIIETGVAYGVTSAFILEALRINGSGRLFSIDLPPLTPNADRHVGALIPNELKGRWELHRGPSKRQLPPLLQKLGAVDMFVHDSLHTLKTMKWEFKTVAPFLGSGSVMIADDIQDNRAFADWCASRPGRLNAVLEEKSKSSLLGLWVSE